MSKHIAHATLPITAETRQPFGLLDNAIRVRAVNDFEQDALHDSVSGRRTGFCGGYSDDVTTSYSSCMPGTAAGSFTQVPPNTVGTTSETLLIASSSTQDAAGGTGVSGMIVFYLDLEYKLNQTIVFLSGTTPVALAGVVAQHFLYGFPIAKGSTVVAPGDVIGNVGSVYLGVGTFSTATGFTKNYMWNRPKDGFISSAIYCVPYGYVGTLWSVKFNSDASTQCSFKTVYRVNRASPWQLLAEDVIGNTTLIQRTIAGGFFPAGAEFTCIVKKISGANIAANFVITTHEIRSDCYQSAVY